MATCLSIINAFHEKRMTAGSVCVHVVRPAFSCLCGGYSLAVSQGVEDKAERDAVPALLKQQATAAPATDNSTHHAVEHVITYPSRLIYYLNEDSESTYHDLDTRAKNQATEGQVSQHRGGMDDEDGYWMTSYIIEILSWSIAGVFSRLIACSVVKASKF